MEPTHRSADRSPARAPALLLGTAILAAGACFAGAAEVAAWSEAHAKTVDRVRAVGAGLYAWYVEQRSGGPVDEALAEFPVAAMPIVDGDTLAALLVPEHLDELVLEDGWGNPLEVRLDREAECGPCLAVRSRGANGVFERDTYDARPFAPGDDEDDLVWADGYFVRWPGAVSE